MVMCQQPRSQMKTFSFGAKATNSHSYGPLRATEETVQVINHISKKRLLKYACNILQHCLNEEMQFWENPDGTLF